MKNEESFSLQEIKSMIAGKCPRPTTNCSYCSIQAHCKSNRHSLRKFGYELMFKRGVQSLTLDEIVGI